MTEPLEDVLVTGHCYCGAIKFEVHIAAGHQPVFSTYCHCDSCRRAHAAALYHVVCVEQSMFKLTAGADELNEFRKPGAAICRAFCRACGTRILNRFPDWTPGGRTLLAFFPNLLDQEHQRALPAALLPKNHHRPQEAVVDEALLQQLFAHRSDAGA